MKVKISNKAFFAAITKGGKFAEKSNNSDITSHFLLEANAEASTLKITASDYEMGLTQIIRNINVVESGVATANADELEKILKKVSKDDEIVLETKETELLVIIGKYNYRVAMFCAEDYINLAPLHDTSDKQQLVINPTIFAERCAIIAHTIGKNETKPSLNGVFVESVEGGKLAFVSTNTKQLSVAYAEAPQPQKVELSIPKRAIAEMQKLLGANDKIYFNDACLVAFGGDLVFYTKLFNDKFPDYKQVVPQHFYADATLGKKEMLELIDGVGIIGENSKFALNVRKDGKLICYAKNSQCETAKAVSTHDNPNLQDSFVAELDSKAIIAFLKKVEESTFVLKYNGELLFQLCSKEFEETTMCVINLGSALLEVEGFQYPNPEKLKAFVDSKPRTKRSSIEESAAESVYTEKTAEESELDEQAEIA